MNEPSVELIETDVTTIEPYLAGHCSYNFFRDPLEEGIIHLRDEKYPMFKGRRIRFKQLMRASKIYYYRRSHTDWEA